MTEDAGAGQPADGGQRVFVYGTLRGGGSNAWRLAAGVCLGPATVAGRLYRVSWYPALVCDPDGGPVVGELWAVPDTLLPALDAFEGPEYRRMRVPVDCADAVTREAWLWEWAAAADGLAIIASGDWLADKQ